MPDAAGAVNPILLSWRQYRLERRMFWRNPSAAFFNFLLPLLFLAGGGAILSDNQHQLDRLVPVHRVIDMTVAGPHIERELAMVKVRGKGEHRMEALRLADAFRARVIDASTESFVFEITGASDKIESFVALMLPLGLVEVSRTGVVAIGRGPEGM